MDQIKLIGKDLREMRERAGLSQRALAEMVGMTQMSIFRIERGKSGNVETLAKIAGVMGCELKITLEPVAEAV
jgi:transcriptional regulator with XRE-family HTH domain